MIRAVIIDDEELGRKVLINLIQKYCPEITIVGEAASVKEAKKIIDQTNPSLIFLDIEMPGGSGFDLLAQFDNATFSVIFVTAYNQYAVKAFKYSAVDYLLKPIDVEELINAVKKVSANTHKKDMQSSLQHFIESYNNSGAAKNNNVALPTQHGLVFIDIADIIRCEADGKYTFCYMRKGDKICSTRSLKDFEEQLTQFGFCRIHHAHLVNISHIKHYTKGDGGHVTMTTGETVTVSKRKKEDFLKKLNKI